MKIFWGICNDNELFLQLPQILRNADVLHKSENPNSSAWIFMKKVDKKWQMASLFFIMPHRIDGNEERSINATHWSQSNFERTISYACNIMEWYLNCRIFHRANNPKIFREIGLVYVKLQMRLSKAFGSIVLYEIHYLGRAVERSDNLGHRGRG